MNYKLFLGLMMVLAVIPLVAAQTNRGETISGSSLWITDMDVKVCNEDGGCDTDKDLDDEGKISEEVSPGGSVEFDIEVTNMFPDNGTDFEIDSIEVTVTIDGIDDGDEIDVDADFNDLDAGDDDSVKVRFDLPVELEEDDYDVLIEIDGDSRNGSQNAKMDLTLEVKKEDNEVRFTNMAFSPSQVQCSRATTLTVGVQNTGNDEQDEAVLEISNEDLGIDVREMFDLNEDPFDEDSKFSKSWRLTIPSDVPVGIYQVDAVVIFNDGRDRETKTADLTVVACSATTTPPTPTTPTTPPKTEEPEEEEEQEDDVVVVRPTPSTPITQPPVVVTPPTLPPTTQEEQPLLKSQSFLTALIVGEILLVIIAIVIIAAVMRKRD